MKFKNKNILIIGGNSDIAKSLINDFINLGSNVFFTCKSDSIVQELKKNIKLINGVECKGYTLDILNFGDHKSFWDTLENKPEIVISCVGYMSSVSDSYYDDNLEALKTMNINYLGLVNLFNIIAEYFKLKKSGVIVGISSVAGDRGRKSNYIYGSAKSGFSSYLSGLRNKLFEDRVQVITVKPGPVKTRMTKNLKISKYLSTDPGVVSSYIIKGIKHKKDIVYIKWYWKWIMMILKIIPESIFKKLNL